MLFALERWFGFLTIVCLFSSVKSVHRYGTPGNTLYVAEDLLDSPRKITVFNRNDAASSDLSRRKRDVSTTTSAVVNQNISTWTTHLNDSHQQLMVHWVGEGSNVIICLARDSSPRNKVGLSASALFISYNYGKNFTNKTEDFKLDDSPDSGYAQLDKFFNHPKYPEFCVFVDSVNKKLYYTSDNGQNIYRSDLNFSPSELAFDEELPEKYLILDKVDTNRKLYLTLDGGKTFKLIQSYVKTFIWSSGSSFSKVFYVERYKPGGTSTAFSASDPTDLINTEILFEDAKDFHIKGDYMFATKQSKEKKTLDLYISHLRSPFHKVEFQTELDLRKFHIADVTDKRIFVSVMHTESLANLYVSEISKNFTQYNFVLSLEQVLCYFPDGNWKNTWLEDVTEDQFTDLYRVEGLKGIYIASKVDSKTPVPNIGPEHLVSMITFDHGVTWDHINPPNEDENGKQLTCYKEAGCSLHLCQKFSQLYPATSPPGNVISDAQRSASIMSSKSAPGVIMATGVLGKSLKGIPGVYISRDAGVTWKKILKDYYFFNYGDHGGVLVAVKYFKSRGETNKILYSTNEGIDWNAYQFNADDLRIYGLMTEPGENTTTFTMFGSANEQHQWIIITIDLRNAFERNCTDLDYKFWSPSPPNSTVTCVMGKRDVFQRRYSHTNCYNGIDYDRPIKQEVCPCGRRDFECDFGFMLSNNECVRNKTIKFDPFAIPPDCKPGMYYKRTKGYRVIDGDVCVMASYLAYAPDMIPCPVKEPTEFILVGLRDRIARIDLKDNSIIYFHDLSPGEKNIVAIEFDMKNNCMYWADIELDKISRQCFVNGTKQEVVVDTDLASIEGMALDFISNVLFFVDGMRKKIEAVRTDLRNEGRMRVTILDSKVLSKPRGIAVHPVAGYLFWTDWDRNNPSVSRANLDGTDVKKLFGDPIVQWPNGITVDFMSDRIYWVDAKEDYIASCDWNGQYFRRIVWNDDKVSHPFAVAVLKDKLFWDDWKAKSIFVADKDSGAHVVTINNSFTGLMDLKVFSHFMQHGVNPCAYDNHKCDAICLGGPAHSYSCLCPDGFVKVNGKCMCPNGLAPSTNMTCPKKPGTTVCADNQFPCKNGLCIAQNWRCDGNNDCGDLSDEIGCPLCSPPMISCDDDTKCYLPHWKCDGDNDCADFSDEADCRSRNCTDKEFQCSNGNCIDSRWLCDGDNDCKDGSDEKNCTVRPSIRQDHLRCSSSGFACHNDSDSMCIPNSWVCDGEVDCPGGVDEDESRCKNSTCAPYMYRCPNGKCIFLSWVCDGDNDCSDPDSPDEKNCTHIGQSKFIPRPSSKPVDFPTNGSCLDWMFRCANGNCVPYWWRCDGNNDCIDNSDELGCGRFIITDETTNATATDVDTAGCGKNEFSCAPDKCIPLSWVCDTAHDCEDGSDEKDCTSQHIRPIIGFHCDKDETPCADGRGCVLDKKLCDGHIDCLDKSDEAHCIIALDDKVECGEGYFACDKDCLSVVMLCNGRQECWDGSDEANCSSTLVNDTIGYQFVSLNVDQSSINSTSFLITCWMPQQKTVTYGFLPSILKAGTGEWKNMTWTNDSVYRFTDLEPFSNYNVTFYIKDSRSNKTYPSMQFLNVTTGEGVPSPPRTFTVRQLTGSRIQVLWNPPKDPKGIIDHYTLYYAPPYPPIEKQVIGTDVTFKGYFKPSMNYTFWVKASNGAYTSESSELTLWFDEIGDVDDLVNVSVSRPNASSAYLEWHKIKGIEGYIVQVRPPAQYARPDAIRTTENSTTLTNLPTGVRLQIDIIAYKGAIQGEPFTIPLRIEGTPDEALNLTAMLLKEKRTSVVLKWSPPTSDRYKDQELIYEVHYTNAKNMAHSRLTNDTKIVTKSNSVEIDNLHACESYVFTVGLIGGPMTKFVEIITRENAKAPVKNLHTVMDAEKQRLTVKWNANCDVLKEAVAYKLDITEETHNKVSRYELTASKNTTLSHFIENVPVGGRYVVCVYSSAEDSAETCTKAARLAVSPPRHVLAWLSPNGHVMVSWHDSDDNKAAGHKYQVIISEKEIPRDLIYPTEDMKVVSAEFSPLLTTAPANVNPLYVSVRSVTDNGYYSDLSEVHTLEMEGSEPEYNAAGAAWWGAVAAAAGAVLLGAALLHLALRHRRLARSFLRFTAHTPRYDSRRGQATIDHDDDDVPPISGFSDDEPLVIA